MREIIRLVAVVLAMTAAPSASAESRASKSVGRLADDASITASARLNFRIEIVSRLDLQSESGARFTVGGSGQRAITSCQDVAGQPISCALDIGQGGTKTLADP